MHYLIENIIRFDVNERSLTHTVTNDNISLGMSGCALLQYLINNQGVTISRNRLLDEVFKKHSLTDSDCNLSQNLSLLRKGFRDLGIHRDILVTTPRVGLTLPEDVSVNLVMFAERSEDRHAVKTKKYIMHSFIMMALIMIALSIAYIKNTHSSDVFPRNVTYTVVDCHVQSMKNNSDIPEKVSELIQRESLHCNKDDVLHYFPNDIISPHSELLVHCNSESADKSECKSYLFWRTV